MALGLPIAFFLLEDRFIAQDPPEIRKRYR
jgi:hypothetical protein